jgi:hypothetical protein
MALNPAHKIIAKLGGEKTVAELLGLELSGVYRWSYPRDRGGTGGRIPARHIKPLIAAAKARGKRLSLNDFFQEPSEVQQ